MSGEKEMSKGRDYKIVYIGKGRFAAVDPQGNILDDTNGHGYKSAYAVHRGYGVTDGGTQ